MTTEQVHPFRLFERLDWLTGAPLMSVIEPYRRRIFEELLYSDPTDDRPGLSAGADPTDVESNGPFADRDGARRSRQNASPGMATPAGDDFALSPAPSGGSSDRLGPTARQRYESMEKAAYAQRRDGETDAMALTRWITTPAGKAAYAEV